MRESNFFYLLVGLLILLIVSPWMTEYMNITAKVFIPASFAVTLMINVWSLMDEKRWFKVGLGLVLFAVLLTIANIFLTLWALKYAVLVVVFLFYVLSAALAMRHVLFGKVVTVNKLVGAVCIYLLLGLIWALMYTFLDLLYRDSFTGLNAVTTGMRTWEFVYYSFVTLTTLGYGDITPVRSAARSLSYLEAIAGQFYIAVLVASLVGAHLARRQQPNAMGDRATNR